MREARRIEQSHNPNYLKSKSSKKEQQIIMDNANVDDIPIQELTLDVPIKITCKHSSASPSSRPFLMRCLFLATKRSDKYFEEQNKRSSKKKSSKKTKKNKKSKHKEASSESEEGLFRTHLFRQPVYLFVYRFR